MRHNSMLTLGLALATGASLAADRAIPVPPTIAMSWGYVIPGSNVNPHRTMGVGFWQRSSGAKPGVGAVFVSTIEYQLPEAVPARVRSATFQFSGRPSQCVGAESVVIDVYAYAADGKSAVADASAGSRVTQLSADCSDKNAFSRPIDVTSIVRQQAVAQAPMAKAPAMAAPGAAVAGAGLPPARPAARPMPSTAPTPMSTYGMNAPERAAAAQARAAAATPAARAASSGAVQRAAILKHAVQ